LFAVVSPGASSKTIIVSKNSRMNAETRSHIAAGSSTPVLTAADEPKPAPARLGSIDGVRAILALAVVWDHLVMQIWPVYVRHIKLSEVSAVLTWTTLHPSPPALFFLLSGFVLSIPVVNNGGRLNRSLRKFYFTRVVRLLAPYYAAILLSLALIATLIGHPTGTHWDKSLPVTPAGVLSHLLMMHDFYKSDQINHALWTMAIETKMCLLFPLLVLLRARIGSFRLFVASLALFIPLSHCLINTAWEGFRLDYYPLFCMGLLTADIAFNTIEPKWRALRAFNSKWWAIVIVPAGLVSAISARQMVSEYTECVVLASLFVLVTGAGASSLRKILTAPIMNWIGVRAYCIYLIHAPLIQVVWILLIRHLPLAPVYQLIALTVVATPFILLCASGFYRLVDMPTMRFIRDRGGR